jgi:DNA-binding transcriptional LysR family regulator
MNGTIRREVRGSAPDTAENLGALRAPRSASLDAIGVFVQVAEAASFRQAAEALGVPRSTVSRKVAELEAQLGARLLRRTTRSVTLTDAGSAYLRACRPALGALGEAARAISHGALEARGRLRVTAAGAFGERFLGAIVEEYLRENPRVEVEVLLTDRYVDLVQEGFDVAFRAGVVGDPSLVARELARSSLRCVASKSYLERRGTPRRPADLAEHECIVYAPLAARGRWTFRTRGRTVHVPVHGRLVVNSLPLALDAAVRGLGVTRVPSALANEAIASGAVVELLSAHAPPATPLYLLYPSGTQTTARVHGFLAIVKKHLTMSGGV